jgi:hypothetical protein
VNWLKDYSQKIDDTNMPQDFTYLDKEEHKFIPNTDDVIKQAETFKDSIFKIINAILKCEIIDDTSENLPIKEAYSHLAPDIGIQEYQALAYCINYNCQVISEDNIFNMLFETMKKNNIFISNSVALLLGILPSEEYLSLIIDLNSKNYKYLLNKSFANQLILFLEKHDISNLLNEEKELIKIAYSYGLLEEIIQYYHNKFKVLYPKKVLPTITYFDKNIKKLLNIVETNEDVKTKLTNTKTNRRTF